MSTLTPRHDQRMICDLSDVAHVPVEIGTAEMLYGRTLMPHHDLRRDLLETLANPWELVSDRGFRYPPAKACQPCLEALALIEATKEEA